MDFNKYFTILLSWLFIIPWGILCLSPMKNRLRVGMKQIIIFFLVLLLIVLPAGAFLVVHFQLTPNLVLFPILLICLFAYNYAVTANLAQATAIYLFFGSFMSVASNLAYAVDAVRHPELGAAEASITFAVYRLLFSLLILLIFFHSFYKYCGFLVDKIQDPGIWCVHAIISSILLLINLSMAPQKYETLFVNNVFRVYLSLQAVIFILEILIGIIFYFVLRNLMDLSDLKVRSNLMEMQEKAYEKQQRYMEENARIRHDFKHTIRSLKGMAEKGDLEGLNKFLDEYVRMMPENEIRIYCKNSALNSLLNHYRSQAEAKKIDVQYHIELPSQEDMPLTNTELCSVVGNILENAINAAGAQKEGERYIRLSLQVAQNNAFYIVAENSFDGNPVQKNGQYMSIGKKRSGIGLRSINSTVEQHNGIAQFHHEGTVFYTDIMLPSAQLQKAQETDSGTL